MRFKAIDARLRGSPGRCPFLISGESNANDDDWCKMTRTELLIQLLKVAIGLAFGAYFVRWSLEVLDLLAPAYEAPAAIGRAS